MIHKSLFITIPLTISAIGSFNNNDSFKNAHLRARPSYSIIHDTSKKSSSSSKKSSSKIVFGTDYFSCSRYGPFELKSNNFSATFTYEVYNISAQNIIERVRVFDISGANVLAASSKSEINYTPGQRKTVTFTVPIKDYWSLDGLTLKFELMNSSTYTVLKTFSATFYPPSHATLNGQSLKREKYNSRSLGFTSVNNKMTGWFEQFDFTKFGDYVDVDYYYRLDIRRHTFKFNNDYTLPYGAINLRFNDDENVFPYYSHDVNKDIVVPMMLDRSDNGYFFKYKNKFYINKRTLQISDTFHDGFILTNDFYLPVNGKKKFNNKTLYFEISSLGYDQISTAISLKYDIDKNLVGICNDGDYCIVGGRR